MARKPRINYKIAPYHGIVIDNNRSMLFQEKENKAEYLNIIKCIEKIFSDDDEQKI